MNFNEYLDALVKNKINLLIKELLDKYNHDEDEVTIELEGALKSYCLGIENDIISDLRAVGGRDYNQKKEREIRRYVNKSAKKNLQDRIKDHKKITSFERTIRQIRESTENYYPHISTVERENIIQANGDAGHKATYNEPFWAALF